MKSKELDDKSLQQLKDRFNFLERELIDLISKSENDYLMDCFSDWMEVRTELNSNTLNVIDVILTKAIEDNK